MEKSNSLENNNKDISVIICTKNDKDTIEQVILSVLKNNPLELIIVDGNSTDNTRVIARKYTSKIFRDPGKGIQLARIIGLHEVKGEYVFFIGSDNILLPNTFKKLKNYMKKHDYIGVALLTRVKERNKSYLTKGIDIRWRLRFYEGKREVIGTPYLFKTEILRKYPFDPKITCDDTDLGFRLTKDGYKLGYSNIFCREIGFDTLKSIISRYKRYGEADYEYYEKYSPTWKLKRKIKSILHPFEAEFIEPITRLKSIKILYYLPTFLLTSILRSKYFLLKAIKNRGERQYYLKNKKVKKFD